MVEIQMDDAVEKPIRILWFLFLLIVFLLGFAPPVATIGGFDLSLSDLIFPILAFGWLASLIFGRFTIKWHRLYIFLAIYFLAMLISSIFSDDPKQSFFKLIGEAYLIGLAAITVQLVDTPRRLRQAICAWLIGTAVAVVIGAGTLLLFYASPGNSFLEYTTYHYGAVPVGNYPRLRSTFITASMFCNYLNVSFVMLLIAGKLDWIKPAFFWILLIAIAICSIFTISAGVGGLFLAAGCWYWFVSTDKKGPFPKFVFVSGLLAADAFLALGFIALQPYPSAPFVWNFPGAAITLYPSSRYLVWSESLRTFADNFLTGTGLGRPSAKVVFQNTDGSKSLLTDAHNIFLSIAAQTGISGLLAITALTVYVLRSAFAKRSENVTAIGLGIAFLAAFVYQGMTGAFEDARHLWVLIGFIFCQNRERRRLGSDLRDRPQEGFAHFAGGSPSQLDLLG